MPSFIQRLWRQSRPGDYIVVAMFLALALSAFWLENLFSPHDSNARKARVLVRNFLVAEVDLQQSDTLEVEGALGRVTLIVAEGGIHVATSSCPNQYCIKQGPVRRAQQVLVCVPNHLVVVIGGQERTNLDAITF